MKAVSIKNLVRKLSSLGLESLENLYSKNNAPRTEQIGILCKALLNLKGEASSVALAEEILSAYNNFSWEEKTEFFHYLETELSADIDEVNEAIRQFQDNPTTQALQRIHDTSESGRLELFRALNMAPMGTESLITLREDLLNSLSEFPELRTVDNDLLHLFRSWFNRGFLEIKRIDWETPAVVLEKLIEYESVHEIMGWPDLRRRLDEDRRCFGFFHPVMPYEPLIFVEVALTNGIIHDVSTLLTKEVTHTDDSIYNTAIFYSINNCLKGLRGVSFGNLLIKQVVEKLKRENASIQTYATLSPVPHFSDWLSSALDQLEFPDDSEKEQARTLLENPGAADLSDEGLKKTMLGICAHYLLNEKSRGQPACPVARFHLGNGATLAYINWQADVSENGLAQSAGMMVNYIYDTATLAKNHELYEQDNTVVCSPKVKKLVPG